MFDINTQKIKILNSESDKIFKELYNENILCKERYIKILEGFSKEFGSDREVAFFSAPGRTEIIGNHTDHQRGKAIAASVSLDIVGVVSLNSDNIIRVKSEGFSETDEININDLSIKENEAGTSKALIRGCLAKFVKLGYLIGGFDMYTSSNVLKGSGLSSSAAFEVLIATVINTLFCEGKEDALSIAKIGQYAENEYFKKPSGMLDQTASSVGGFAYMDFKDDKNPKIKKIDFDFERFGYSIFVVDTGGSHAELTDEYSSIREDLKEISKKFGKTILREIDEEEFFDKISTLKNNISDRAILRAIHIFNENKRVDMFCDSLINEDVESIFKLVKESGDSSFKYLQNVYSPANVKTQGLSLALCLSERILKGEGALRVHGGGFAGTIQAYVPKDKEEEYKEEMEKVFGKGSCIKLFIRPYGGIKVI